jgi:hypothetical protein
LLVLVSDGVVVVPPMVSVVWQSNGVASSRPRRGARILMGVTPR